MSKEGVKRPIVIPAKKEVKVHIIKNALQIAELTRKEYFDLLKST